MPLIMETTVSRDTSVPPTDEQYAFLQAFGSWGMFINIGVTRVETEEQLALFMSRVRFFERFCNILSAPNEDATDYVPWPIPEELVRSLMPITSNVSTITKTQFIKNCVKVYHTDPL